MKTTIAFVLFIFSTAAAADIFDIISTVTSGGANLVKEQPSTSKPTAQPVRLVSVTNARERLKIAPKVADQALLAHFYALSEDGEQEEIPGILRDDGFFVYQLEPQRLVLQKASYKAGSIQDIDTVMRDEYISDAYTDSIAKRYIAFAKKRGNAAKLYRSPMDIEVNRAVEKGTGYFVQYRSKEKAYFGLDNVLIETAPSGEIVSMLARNNQVSAGAEAIKYVQIIYGRKIISEFENGITHEKMRDLYLRDL